MAYDYHDPHATRPEPQYFAVSVQKFALMSILTLGVYEFYWFYRNWCFIRDRDAVSMRPFWRAFFAPVWMKQLIADVDANRGEVRGLAGGQANGLFIGYLVLSALWRLPDPYWLVSMLSWVALVPVVTLIARVNRPSPRGLLENSRWGMKHGVLGMVTVPLLLFIVTGTLNLTPSTQVVTGSRMWDHNVEFLRDAGLLEDGEEVLYFYSQDLVSMENDGNMLTDSKVASYWIDEDTGAFVTETARYEEIAAVDVSYSGSFASHTLITVRRDDGSSFILTVSPEDDKDDDFVDALEMRVP